MSPDPIEVGEAEVLDSPPAERPTGGRGFVYESEGAPCCSGCGCLAVGLLLLLMFKLGAVLSALVVIIVGGWLSMLLLRLAGVRRFSVAYVYLLPPVFMSMVNLVTQLFRGVPLYSWREVAFGTLVIWAFLWYAGRRWRR
jgi:hypothetical protein